MHTTYLPLIVISLLLTVRGFSQDSTHITQPLNSAQQMLALPGKLTIGGYGQLDYVQKLDADKYNNASLDVHRLVMLFGYKFDSRTSFVTEIEFEHVKEVYIEQAFLDYKINRYMNFRTGLLLIPMGFINEYHEPTSFNGAQRPFTDTYIVPSTWREIGAGITGNFLNAGINYQLYLFNGFNSYDGEARLNGASSFRAGRQKAARSFMSSPNLGARVQYYGLPSLNLSLSSYYGKSQSTLYNGIDKNDTEAVRKADSSVVNTFWTGLDALYQKKAWDLRFQFYYVGIQNSLNYNQFTGSDLGSALLGYYLEAGYDILRFFPSTTQKLKPFIRYELVNTHFRTEGDMLKNDAYNRNYIITGIGWWMSPGAVLKADLQFGSHKASDIFTKTINLGMGVRF